jgi:hypothetical protein
MKDRFRISRKVGFRQVAESPAGAGHVGPRATGERLSTVCADGFAPSSASGRCKLNPT